jgi:uncharacterized C2H2 Zn-finger protein
MPEAECPKCGLKFDAKSQRTYKGIGHDIKTSIQGFRKPPEVWIDESAQVRCPNCNAVFTSQALKYFGIISPKGMKVLIGLFVLGFIIVAIFELYKSF